MVMKILGENLEQWISEGISMGFTTLVEALLPFTIEQVTSFIATFFISTSIALGLILIGVPVEKKGYRIIKNIVELLSSVK